MPKGAAHLLIEDGMSRSMKCPRHAKASGGHVLERRFWPTDNFARTREHRKYCRFSYSHERKGRLSKPFCD